MCPKFVRVFLKLIVSVLNSFGHSSHCLRDFGFRFATYSMFFGVHWTNFCLGHVALESNENNSSISISSNNNCASADSATIKTNYERPKSCLGQQHSYCDTVQPIIEALVQTETRTAAVAAVRAATAAITAAVS